MEPGAKKCTWAHGCDPWGQSPDDSWVMSHRQRISLGVLTTCAELLYVRMQSLYGYCRTRYAVSLQYRPFVEIILGDVSQISMTGEA